MIYEVKRILKSRCHTKRTWPCPFVFSYDNDKDLKVCFLMTHFKYPSHVCQKNFKIETLIIWNTDRIPMAETYTHFVANKTIFQNLIFIFLMQLMRLFCQYAISVIWKLLADVPPFYNMLSFDTISILGDFNRQNKWHEVPRCHDCFIYRKLNTCSMSGDYKKFFLEENISSGLRIWGTYFKTEF